MSGAAAVARNTWVAQQDAVFSDSTAHRVEHCAAAAVLPGFDSTNAKARLGSAFHEHRELLVTLGYRRAFRALTAIAAKWDVERLPLARMAAGCTWAPPQGSLVEVSLACLPDGSVVQVEGGHGSYPDLPQGAFAPGQLDVMWSEPDPLVMVGGRPTCPVGSVLFVADYKTGDPDAVPPVEENAQLLNLAYKAARWTGAVSVVPAIIFVDWQGAMSWDAPPAPLHEDDLDLVWEGILARQKRANAQLAALTRGPLTPSSLNLSYSVGAHCTWCKSRFACPAVVGEVKSLVEAPPEGPLSADDAARLARLVPLIETLSKKIRATLEDYVDEHGPIELGEGDVWGPHDVSKDVVVPSLALPPLVEHFKGAAFHAVEISKAAIDRVAKAEGMKPGETRSLFGELRKAGAFQRTTSVWWSAHKGKKTS